MWHNRRRGGRNGDLSHRLRACTTWHSAAICRLYWRPWSGSARPALSSAHSDCAERPRMRAGRPNPIGLAPARALRGMRKIRRSAAPMDVPAPGAVPCERDRRSRSERMSSPRVMASAMRARPDWYALKGTPPARRKPGRMAIRRGLRCAPTGAPFLCKPRPHLGPRALALDYCPSPIG